jgi:hypothetical protein
VTFVDAAGRYSEKHGARALHQLLKRAFELQGRTVETVESWCIKLKGRVVLQGQGHGLKPAVTGTLSQGDDGC